MTDDSQGRRKGQYRTWLALATVLVLLALLIIPPYISVTRYRSRITQVLSTALGRPVRIASIELRMLPRPSFVMTDLVVEEDSAYGAEPVLHANTVTAAIRILPLWRGRLQISRISADEASVNLVRSGVGRWNLDPFFRSAAARPGSGQNSAVPFPYLEATNSRINIKNGAEKLPYSLVGADLSFWQDRPGEWRVRLRGQPARTDVNLDLPDTGVLRVEATLHRAPELRDMPLHVDVDWREAQFGQLSRLVMGSDEGWRGNLAGEMHVDGSPAAARITARLRAYGVHRAEFTPASPLDFDATCSLTYHFSLRSIENLVCDSPVGGGRARVTAQFPVEAGNRNLTIEMDRVPAQVGVDALHTLRSGIDPALEAQGSISGSISYHPLDGQPQPSTALGTRRNGSHNHGPAPSPLTGSLTTTEIRFSGTGLARPLQLPRITLEPAPGQLAALQASLALPAGAPAPLVIALRVGRQGYQATVHGSSTLSQLHEWRQLFGASSSPLDSLTGPPASVDVSALGPWIVSEPAPDALPVSAALPASTPLVAPGPTDHLGVSLVLHDSVWKADFLASPLELPAATVHFDESGARWSAAAFQYGPLRGTASLTVPAPCDNRKECAPQFDVHLGTEDVSTLQAAILGARKSGTLLSSLLNRLRPAQSPAWPELSGTVRADSVVAGPVSLYKPTAEVHIKAAGATVDSFTAGLLGGQITGSATITPGDKPAYHIEANCSGLVAAQMGQLLHMSWTGDPLTLSGKVDMTGYTGSDLADSAKGTLHFEWRRGGLSGADTGAPPSLARFDSWTAEADLSGGGVHLGQNQLVHGSRKTSVNATAKLGDPVTIRFTPSQDAQAPKP